MPDCASRVAYPELHALVAGIFAACGLPAADADWVARCLIEADLRGVASHGISRIPVYAKRLRKGLVNPTPKLAVEKATPCAARVMGDNGMGYVVGRRAMREAIDRANGMGVGLVLACNSNHFGMAASYLQMALDAGLAAVALTNAPPAMPVWGGRKPFLGTSPLAVAAPGGRVPLMLDMATSVAAKGRIRRALQQDEAIPAGWALDETGRPTTDPEAALRGVVLPLGGPKGSGMSLMMEALAGVMSGAAFGGQVGNQNEDFTRPQNVGHLFLAMRTDLFMPQAEYANRMDALIERAVSTPLAAGFDEILMPGEPEARRAEQGRREGVPLNAAERELLAREATLAGVPAPDFARSRVEGMSSPRAGGSVLDR